MPSRDWRARGRYTGAHSRLHDEERHDHRADAECHRGNQCRVMKPVDTNDGDQHRGERDTSGVVNAPAERSLSFDRWRCRDPVMAKFAMRHVTGWNVNAGNL